ncbi:MAG: tetratricopeptide repeat protein [Gammaproteobacteria bacterium]|nr:tetratricopeptide repeat protein [Gammaproteobacteria bacterium]
MDSNPDFVFDATDESFRQLVLENSTRGPVLVNFWSAGVGPCLRVWDTLKALVQSYQGRFLLVNINTDSYGQLSRQLGVNSLPTVHIYRDGEVVHRIHGAESEKSFIDAIDRYLATPSDKVLAHATALFHSGDQGKAVDVLVQLVAADPFNMRVTAALLKFLIVMKAYQRGLDVVAGLDESMQQKPEIGSLKTHLELLVESGHDRSALIDELARNDLPETRFRLAATCVLENDFEAALEQLMIVVEKHRHFRDDIGRRSMLALFDLLGRDHPLTSVYWQKLSSYLH